MVLKGRIDADSICGFVCNICLKDSTSSSSVNNPNTIRLSYEDPFCNSVTRGGLDRKPKTQRAYFLRAFENIAVIKTKEEVQSEAEKPKEEPEKKTRRI